MGGKGKGHRFGPGNKAGVGHGRPKVAEEFRERAKKLVDAKVIAYWEDEIELRERAIMTPAGPMDMVCRGKDSMKAAELLTAYGYGRPAQTIEKTVTHVKRSPREMSLEEIEARLERIRAGNGNGVAH